MEEVKTVQPAQEAEEKNTVALVGMILSIIWLVFLITIFWAGLWCILLFLWFILGIIWLFSKPRGKAYVAVWIPLTIALIVIAGVSYLWNSVKAPTQEFISWAESQQESQRFENMNQDVFNEIASVEFNKIVDQLTWSDFEALLADTTWDNTIEKVAYIFFGAMREGLENSFDAYDQQISEWDNWDLLEVIENSDETLDNTLTNEEVVEEVPEETIEEVEGVDEVNTEDNWEVNEIFE